MRARARRRPGRGRPASAQGRPGRAAAGTAATRSCGPDRERAGPQAGNEGSRPRRSRRGAPSRGDRRKSAGGAAWPRTRPRAAEAVARRLSPTSKMASTHSPSSQVAPAGTSSSWSPPRSALAKASELSNRNTMLRKGPRNVLPRRVPTQSAERDPGRARREAALRRSTCGSLCWARDTWEAPWRAWHAGAVTRCASGAPGWTTRCSRPASGASRTPV